MIIYFSSLVIDLVMIARPVVLIPVWGFSALGFQCALRNNAATAIPESWNSTTASDYGWMLIFSLSVAAVYIMNQIADVEVDRKNSGMPLIARNIVSLPSAIIVLLFYSLISVLLPLLFGHYCLAIAAAAALLLGYVYSFKPMRFSGRPFADFLSNAFGYGIIAFSVGWILAGKTLFSFAFLLGATPYFLLMCGGSISSTLPDIEGDRIDRKKTTAVVLGTMPAHLFATAFIIGAAISGIMVRDLVAVFCAVSSLPLYLLFCIKKNRIFMEATYKIGGSFCMIAAFTALPLFFPIAVVVFVSTWLYFRIRHGIVYPSLIPLSIEK